MPETTVKMLGSIISSSGNNSASMHVSFGSNLSQWEKIVVVANVRCWSAASGGTSQTYGQCSFRIDGNTQTDLTTTFVEGNNSYTTDSSQNGSGNLQIRGTSLNGAGGAGAGYARVFKFTIWNPGRYSAVVGASNESFNGIIDSTSPQIFYTASNISNYHNCLATFSGRGPCYGIYLNAPTNTGTNYWANNSRMDVYGYPNGT